MGVAIFGETKYNKFNNTKFEEMRLSKDMTCFFIGHRDAPDRLASALDELVERHIAEYGVQEFTVGQYGHFDYLAAAAVQKAKERHPEVRLIYLRPYHPAERPIETPKGFDGSFYPPGMEHVPKSLAIVRANRYMVDHSDYLIAYVWHPSNAYGLVEYAQRREKRGLIRVTLLAVSSTKNLGHNRGEKYG